MPACDVDSPVVLKYQFMAAPGGAEPCRSVPGSFHQHLIRLLFPSVIDLVRITVTFDKRVQGTQLQAG